MNTEQKLKQLFDYQKFAGNPRLARLIEESESGAEELSEDSLFLVSAAGEQHGGGIFVNDEPKN